MANLQTEVEAGDFVTYPNVINLSCKIMCYFVSVGNSSVTNDNCCVYALVASYKSATFSFTLYILLSIAFGAWKGP